MAFVNERLFGLKNGSSVQIRSYEPSDALKLMTFSEQVASETNHTLKYPEMPKLPLEQLEGLISRINNHPVNFSIGVFQNESLIGNLRFFQRNPEHPWIKHIGAFGMAVRQKFWGLGVGSLLLKVMETEAQLLGISRIEAEVRAENSAGIQLYLKNGFNIEGRREQAVFIDGQFQDEFYISKLIDF